MSQDPKLKQTAVMANVVGQIGCVTAFVAVLIIGIAFGLGWLLDDFMGNDRRIMTVVLMLASFPITLYAMTRISLIMIGRIQKSAIVKQTGQEIHSDEKDNTTA